MISQWRCIQQNMGAWHGSFTQFSPEGEQVKDTPSVLTLEEVELGEKMQLTLERSPESGSKEITRREFFAPGPAPYVYFFESGAFSQGSSQWAAFGQFGAEVSIKVGDRRVRFVIMYDSGSDGTSSIKYVTLIRETQAGGTQFTEPDMTPAKLLGQYTGTVSALHATMQPMSVGTSLWTFAWTPEQAGLTAKETVARETVAEEMTDEENDETNLQTLLLNSNHSEQGLHSKRPISLTAPDAEGLAYQLMPLPNGAYCLLPATLRQNIAFRIEAGWLRTDGNRSRLIRYYDSRGVWTHSALVEDRSFTDCGN